MFGVFFLKSASIVSEMKIGLIYLLLMSELHLKKEDMVNPEGLIRREEWMFYIFSLSLVSFLSNSMHCPYSLSFNSYTLNSFVLASEEEYMLQQSMW